MKKNILKIMLAASVLSIHPAFAGNDIDNMSIQVRNITGRQAANLPLHDFAYNMELSANETAKNSPLSGSLPPYGNDPYITIYRDDGANIQAHLKIFDPAIGNRIIWEGNVVYDKALNKISATTERDAGAHCIITTKFVQPDQGNPLTTFDVMCF